MPAGVYNPADAAKVTALMVRLRLTRAEIAREAGLTHAGPLSHWLAGNRDCANKSSTRAGAAAMKWYEAARHRPTPPPPVKPAPYKRADVTRVKKEMERLRLFQSDVANALGITPTSLSAWMIGKDVFQPAVQDAGAKAVRWYEQNKNRPTPTASAIAAPPPYDVADAKRVKALIARLRVTQADVARESSGDGGRFSQWLNGRNVHREATLKAGAAAMRWYEANKDRPPLTEAEQRHLAKERRRVSRHKTKPGMKKALARIDAGRGAASEAPTGRRRSQTPARMKPQPGVKIKAQPDGSRARPAAKRSRPQGGSTASATKRLRSREEASAAALCALASGGGLYGSLGI